MILRKFISKVLIIALGCNNTLDNRIRMSDPLNFKFVVVGNSAVGKTRLLVRYVENTFTTAFYNTVGVDFKMKQIMIDNKKVRIQIWDTAGQERYRTLTSSIYKRANGVMIVYDVTDRASFEALRGWRDEVQKNLDRDALMMVIGNKIDKEGERVVSTEEGEEFAKGHGYLFIETSAAEDTYVKEAFQQLARAIYNKLREEEGDNKSLQKQESKKEAIKLDPVLHGNSQDLPSLGERGVSNRGYQCQC